MHLVHLGLQLLAASHRASASGSFHAPSRLCSLHNFFSSARRSSHSRWIATWAVLRQAEGHCMDVTRENFWETLPHVRESLRRCSFFAVDCEFTGLHLNHAPAEYYSQDLRERYEEWAASARQFAVLQYGLSAFIDTPRGLEAVIYNFWLFPRPVGRHNSGRFFSCQAASLQFLAEQGFDFNKCIHKGIPSLPAGVRDRTVAKLQQQQQAQAEEGSLHMGLPITRPEDIAFVQDLTVETLAWLESDAPTLTLEEVTPHRRGMQWQQLRKLREDHSFSIKAVKGPTGKSALQLTQMSEEELEVLEQADRDSQLEDVHTSAGFTAVVEAMRDSGKPAVMHNGIFDLHHTLHGFAEILPRSWARFKLLANEWFPGGVYDTKYLVQNLKPKSQAERDRQMFPMTSLDSAHARVHDPEFKKAVKACLNVEWNGVKTYLAPGCERYLGRACLHEAGYDAYLTGVLFANLAHLHSLQAQAAATPAPTQERPTFLGSVWGGAQSLFASLNPRSASSHTPFTLEHVQALQNRINVSHTDVPYANLSGPDPTPFRHHVFHVTLKPGTNLLRLAYLVQALLGIGRPWVHRGSQPMEATIAFPCNTPESWHGVARMLMELHESRVDPRMLSQEQRRDPRWVAAALMQQQLPQLQGGRVLPMDFYRPPPLQKRKAPERPTSASESDDSADDGEPEPKRGAVGVL